MIKLHEARCLTFCMHVNCALDTSSKYVIIHIPRVNVYLHRCATAIAQVEHKYITVQVHSQAHDANELWHFPRQIIIPSHRHRGCDYHGSDPTETSRIRRVGLLLPARALVSLKMLTCAQVPLYPCWQAGVHYRRTFSPPSPLTRSFGTTIRSTFVHSHTEHRRCALKRPTAANRDIG